MLNSIHKFYFYFGAQTFPYLMRVDTVEVFRTCETISMSRLTNYPDEPGLRGSAKPYMGNGLYRSIVSRSFEPTDPLC